MTPTKHRGGSALVGVWVAVLFVATHAWAVYLAHGWKCNAGEAEACEGNGTWLFGDDPALSWQFLTVTALAVMSIGALVRARRIGSGATIGALLLAGTVVLTVLVWIEPMTT